MATVKDFGSYAIVNGEKRVNLCSNDYLGLSHNTRVVHAGNASRQVSPCSSRLVSGNHIGFQSLETALAKHRGTEAALVYPTGYAACVGVLTALGGKDSVIFSDELNHASIVDGCRLSGAKIKVFSHNNYTELEELLRNESLRKIIVTEGVFSMDGDSADLNAMTQLAVAQNALTIVDDSHGDFLRGPDFSGTPAEKGVKVDVHVSSLSKALGCFGGYVATSDEVKELLINVSRQFIYTSALPEALCSAALVALRVAQKGNKQQRLEKNISKFFSSIKKIGFSISRPNCPIMPIMIGNERRAADFSQKLLVNGVFVQAIRYPTVAEGRARLRISMTSMHNSQDLAFAADAFKKTFEDLKF